MPLAERGRQHHLIYMYARYLEHKDPRLEENSDVLLTNFADQYGYTATEMVNIFVAEVLAHDERACTLPGCLDEFKRENEKKKRRPT